MYKYLLVSARMNRAVLALIKLFKSHFIIYMLLYMSRNTMAYLSVSRFHRPAFIIGGNNGLFESLKVNSMPNPYGMGMRDENSNYNVYQEEPVQQMYQPYQMAPRQRFGYNNAPYNNRYSTYRGGNPMYNNNNNQFRQYRYPNRRPYNTYQRNIGSINSFQLTPIDWSTRQLVEIKKDFYDLSYEADSRPGEEIEEILKRHNIKIEGDVPLPKPVNTFSEAVFNEPIQRIISNLQFIEPTPIQKVGWTSCLTGRDVVGVAQTGSGKTLTFLLPGLLHLLAQPPSGTGGPIVLVLAPTRELCLQISNDAKPYLNALNLRGVTIYGGADRFAQQNRIMNGVDVMIIGFLNSGVVKLDRVSYFVMDEADRMLDMGFEPQIRNIHSQIRPDRQTLMFSATWPNEIKSLATEFCKNNCIYIQVGDLELTINPNIKQNIFVMNPNDIKTSLFRYLESEGSNKKIIIFTDFRLMADQLASELRYRNINAISLHGDKSQNSRERILSSFRNGNSNVLVATDVAARGLDIKDIDCVINLDAPKNLSDYIHRIGRTARGDKHGESILYISTDSITPAKTKFVQQLIPILKSLGVPISPELQSLKN